MTQEDKQLLLKDLCARLPYGVKIKLGDYDYQVCGYNSEKEMPVKIWYYYDSNLTLKSYIDVYLTDYRPYLRPMSNIASLISAKEWSSLGGIELIDFYNSNHIDYRGLIPKGLALEAPEEMYKL